MTADSAAPTPEARAPRCTTCGEPFGTERGKFCSNSFHRAPAREASTAPELTAREVTKLANRALNFMATYAPANEVSQDAMAAVHRLSEMARRAAPPPSDADARWAIRHDVLAHAAYTIGRQESRATVAALTADRATLNDENVALHRAVQERDARLHDAERERDALREVVENFALIERHTETLAGRSDLYRMPFGAFAGASWFDSREAAVTDWLRAPRGTAR